MDDPVKKPFEILYREGPLSFLKRTCGYLTTITKVERTRIMHGYYMKNWLERKANRELLVKLRARGTSKNAKPLISVIIPTYNRGRLLCERTIPSILNQTYKNFELLIIGDHCTDNTEELVKKFNDKRITFYNLPKRGNYPKDPNKRWMVAGTIPSNKGLELARGEWIAHLDDDDEFSPDHLEVLLNHALQYDLEFVYGAVNMEVKPGLWVKVGSYPLEAGKVSHLSILYHSKLRFIKYCPYSWKYEEPDDWNLLRRIVEAGVKIGFVDKIVGKHYVEKSQ